MVLKMSHPTYQFLRICFAIRNPSLSVFSRSIFFLSVFGLTLTFSHDAITPTPFFSVLHLRGYIFSVLA